MSDARARPDGDAPVIIRYGPAAGGPLPNHLVICARVAGPGELVLELAVDPRSGAASARASDGRAGAARRGAAATTLCRRPTPQGDILFAPLSVSPSGSTVEVEFLDEAGEPVESISCVVDLESGVASARATEPGATQRREGTGLPGEGASSGAVVSAGASLDAEGSTDVPDDSRDAARGATNAPADSTVDAVGAIGAVNDARSTHGGAPAGDAAGEAAGESAAVSSAGSSGPPARWPPAVGEDSRAIGPPGALFQPRMLTLVGVKRSAVNAHIELCLDDGGYTEEYVLLVPGEPARRIKLFRATPRAPACPRISVPAATKAVLLLARDRDRQLVPDLSAHVDLAKARFQSGPLDNGTIESVAKLLQPGPAFQPDVSLCASCQKPSAVGMLLALEELSTRRRREIRRRFQPPPHARGVCARCAKELSIRRTELIGQEMLGAASSTAAGVAVALAAAGQLVTTTAPGRWLVDWFATQAPLHLGLDVALTITAALGSLAAVLTPWRALVGDPLSAALSSLRAGEMPGAGQAARPLAVAGALGGLAWTYAALPIDRLEIAVYDAFPIATAAGLGLGLGVPWLLKAMRARREAAGDGAGGAPAASPPARRP